MDMEVEYNKYRTVDEDEVKKTASSYKAVAIMLGFFFIISIIIIGVVSNRAALLTDKINDLSTFSNNNASLWINQVSGSSLPGKTVILQVRQNASTTTLSAVMIYFNPAGSLTAAQYGSTGSYVATYSGVWSFSVSSGVQISFSGQTVGADISTLADVWNLYMVDNNHYAIVSQSTGKLLGAIYRSDIFAGDLTGSASSTTYLAPVYKQIQMQTMSETMQWLSGNTIVSRNMTSATYPLVKSFYNSNGTVTRMTMKNDGAVVSTDVGTWGVFVDSYSRVLHWSQFPTLFGGNNRSEIWYSGITGMFPTIGPIITSSGAFDESAGGIPRFEGYAYFNEVSGGM
eukprot:TRINITY_DN3254_c0_g1_i1.p1 TRINITY_DN3254_c0_g1~~TRINITY_DN3254_c0_g1_i1.p1  ORF type:complete len:350 (-),score=93.89 TRINITY_DN3254_c0_g1_i1:67-1092(-)